MDIKKEQIEKMATEYAKQFDYAEDSSPFLDYIAGFEKALSLFAVSGRSELLCDFLEWYDESLTLEEREMEVKTFVDMKSHNCH